MIATVCDRFGGYPSEYVKNRSYDELLLDNEAAKHFNKIDRLNKEAEYKALYGGK